MADVDARGKVGRMKRIVKTPLTYLLLLAAALFLVVVVPLILPFAVNKAEDISYYFFPSAQRAYQYGVAHFSVADPGDYDLNRAEDFFYRAAALDPHLPYVWHELARISFLHGNLPKALAQINIQIDNEGDQTPNSYYVRGLIEGYMEDYADSERDYAHFIQFDPHDWAGVNDYAWVLLKDHKPQEADSAIALVLSYASNNPWLLNSDAIALSELGSTTGARARIDAAAVAVAKLSPGDWSYAYPGNDPAIASQGLAAFRAAVLQNMHDIESGKTLQAAQ